jgi:hypothetical protein
VFTLKVINGFQIHSSAALEIPAMQPGLRAFIGVHPPWPERRVPNWHIRRFEIAEGKMAEWFGEEDLVDSQRVELKSLEEVEELIKKWGFDPAQFQQSLNTEYPL